MGLYDNVLLTVICYLGVANGMGYEWNDVGYYRARWNGPIMAV